MDVHTILRAARAAAPELPESTVLQAVAYSPGTPPHDGVDRNEEIRELVCVALYNELLPQDHRFARYLLEQEIARHRAEGEGMLDNLRRCGYLLYRLGHVGDSVLLWEAKDVHFDTYCGFDIQLLIGAGYDATVAYLKGQPDSAAAVEYLEDCQRAGDFDDMVAYNQWITSYLEIEET